MEYDIVVDWGWCLCIIGWKWLEDWVCWVWRDVRVCGFLDVLLDFCWVKDCGVYECCIIVCECCNVGWIFWYRWEFWDLKGV